jgi:hypothetical protein
MEELTIATIPDERIEARIYLIRGKKVMLDRDLSALYGVATKVLKQAVKRNLERFPEDFMFELSLNEAKSLRSQFVTLNQGEHIKYAPYAFTELGVAMLSSVLKSERAVLVNIQIMRTFVKLRDILAHHDNLHLKFEDMEKRYDKQFRVVFDALRRLITEEDDQKPEIGFRE